MLPLYKESARGRGRERQARGSLTNARGRVREWVVKEGMRGMRGRLVCTCVPQQFVKNFERIVARLFAYGLQMPHITLHKVEYHS